LNDQLTNVKENTEKNDYPEECEKSLIKIGQRLNPILLQIVKNVTGDDEYDDEEEIIETIRRRRGGNLGDMTEQLSKSLKNM